MNHETLQPRCNAELTVVLGYQSGKMRINAVTKPSQRMNYWNLKNGRNTMTRMIQRDA